jgi:predicted SAM-dependent methyltransferase
VVLDGYIRSLSESPPGWKNIVPANVRESVQVAVTNLMAPLTRRGSRKFGTTGLRLHIGCGRNHLPGWVNIDLAGLGADLPWDLRHRLPFYDGSSAAIFHEHLLEHLPIDGALSLLRECWRLLRPGGILRVGVPDFGRYLLDSISPNGFIDTNRPNRPTRLLAVAEVAYCHGHRSIWDSETLCLAVLEAGFQAPTERPYGISAIEPAPDSAGRSAETLYVEAEKQGS